MFFSLNKKFIYTIALFFLFTAALFVFTFYNIYGSKLQEEQRSTFLRNQQYIELLYENINLRNALDNIITTNKIPSGEKLNNLLKNKKDIRSQQEELSLERKKTAEMVQTYNERYEALQQAVRIVIFSSVLIILSMLLLWTLIKRWVIAPINKLAAASRQVAAGNFATRVNTFSHQVFTDEFDDLSHTFNQMLENIENGILEIKNKETFLQSLIDGIPDGIRVIDDNYNIIIANKEYYRQAGKKAQCSKCYASSQNLKNPCPASLYMCPLQEINHKHLKKVKFVQQFAKYPNRHLSINAAPLTINTNGKQNSYIVEVIRDLSDDIRFSHQQKLSSLGFLATSVAHEMKNHLGSIRMILEAILDKFYKDIPDDNEEKQYLSMINNQLISCINVPERLLKLSRYSNDDQQEIKYINSVKEVIDLLDYEAKRNGVTVELNAPDENLSIIGFEADFKMAIINIIQNAFKAMPNGGKLKINTYQKDNGQNVLEIEDNGIGIPKDKINRIFEPFFSEGKNSQNKGTGLGLAIVKSIIEKINGTLSVRSQENKGTCFTMEFPSSNTTNAPLRKKKSLHK